MKRYLIVIMLLMPSLSWNADAQTRSIVADNEEYVADFVIVSNGVKELAIKSDVKENIMFRVDVAEEDIPILISGPFPIEMTDTGSQKSIASFYGGLEVDPVNGEIRLKFSNSGKKEYRVLVVKTKSAAITVLPVKGDQ